MIKSVSVGRKAPVFALPDQAGVVRDLRTVTSAAGTSKFIVLYFYPRDDTPGCTIEARDFSKLLPSFKRRKAVVFGISGGEAEDKQRFCRKHRLAVPLLADTDLEVVRRYGVYGTKKFMGRSFKGIKRMTFVLDQSLSVLRVFENVKAAGHAAEVLEFLDSLKSDRTPSRKARRAPRTRVARRMLKSRVRGK